MSILNPWIGYCGEFLLLAVLALICLSVVNHLFKTAIQTRFFIHLTAIKYRLDGVAFTKWQWIKRTVGMYCYLVRYPHWESEHTIGRTVYRRGPFGSAVMICELGDEWAGERD